VLIALAVALYSASRAVENFIKGINVIYGETEARGFLHLKSSDAWADLGADLRAGLRGVSVVAAVPATLAFLTPEGWGASLAFVLRWPILFGFGIAGIAVLYRYGPSKRFGALALVNAGGGAGLRALGGGIAGLQPLCGSRLPATTRRSARWRRESCS